MNAGGAFFSGVNRAETGNNDGGTFSGVESQTTLMAAQSDKQASKADKLLRKIAGWRFTFEESRDDLALLRSISEGTYAGDKPGDPSFHAYAAALNAANEFASQALDVLELIPFNNRLADIQEEYMPSYPPMSPVTSAFFAGWMVLDARDALTGLTLGELLVHSLGHTGKFDHLRKAMVALNNSFCSFYEVTAVDDNGATLWDIAGEQEIQCWNSSGYPGRPGEIWYVRLAPPFAGGCHRSVTLHTPCVFKEGNRRVWEGFFQRHLGSEGAGGRSLRDYLKYGKSLPYWLEFVLQAFWGYTGNMIEVAGVPDDPASLPHSHPKHRL
jgi:hypothetical protein